MKRPLLPFLILILAAHALAAEAPRPANDLEVIQAVAAKARAVLGDNVGLPEIAADWALARPLCANWNYNSFSVRLLARAFAVIGDAKYLEAAVRKARFGVIPGQLTGGPRAGRWMDAHNARPAYHYIMMCALAQLAAAMPPLHENRIEVVRSLSLGLAARNTEMASRGVMNKAHAMEALLLTRSAFGNDPAFMRETKTGDALRSLALLVSAEAHHGKSPLAPGPWGKFLEHIFASGR